MPSRGLAPGARPVAAACFRPCASAWRRARLGAHLVALRGFRREVAVWTCARLRRETRLQLQARDSHPVADGTWCTGTAKATDADTRHGPPPPTTREVSMSRYSIPAQHPGLTVIVGWDNPSDDVLRAGVRSVDQGRRGSVPPVDRYGTRGDPHGRGAPGPARRLGHDPDRPRGPPHPRSAGGHAADPAPAVGAPASCTTLGRPAPTVPNVQPRGSLVLPTGHEHQP